MKTKVFFLVIFLFNILLVGCEDPVIVPNPPKPIVVSGDAYASPASIIAGQTTTIFLTELVNVAKTTIDEIPVLVSSVYTPTTTTTYIVKFFGKDNLVYKTKNVTVNVSPAPIPTKRDTIINLLSYGSFKRVKNEWKINGVWDEMTISDMESRRLLSFTKDGKMKDYDPLGIGLTFDGNYQISTDLTFLIYGTMEYEFVILNDKQMIITYWSTIIDPVTHQLIQKGRQIRVTYDRVK